ncbi:replication protein A 70 kDa DNA-binding subunit D-like [Salvia miltiorrhiza]|uniref:replication protein A 70 kDa DNA-binding subunit D-like n=1 Tax=Salvia miltiorrhiza TaxID=226208 RepID=UPI0025AB833C|nr:replication protein A 70 kDa DNA-binding subunit D-like [Salvia miltiorrhiza]
MSADDIISREEQANGEVRQVDGRYPSIHPEKELILKKYTVVTETFDSIDMKIQYNFVEFKDIESKFDKKEDFDVFGTLVRVENSKMVPMKTTSGAHSKTVRDITIVNKENQFMEISLWEDMAINEGDKLQKVLEQNPIIVITNVAAKKFLGALQLQSTVRSVLQTSPECPEIKHMKQRSYETYDPLRITA